MSVKQQFINEIEKEPARSAWRKGVKQYAEDLIYNLDNEVVAKKAKISEKDLLQDADSWEMYSWCGFSLCYNYQNAERLCTPSELKITRNGMRKPNKYEEWLDVQVRALYQASSLILEIAKRV